MMTRPPVSMWPTTEYAYTGSPEIAFVVDTHSQQRARNTAAAPGAKITYIRNELAYRLYNEAQRNVSGKVAQRYSDPHCGANSCRNCNHYSANYHRLPDGTFREQKDGRCYCKSVTGTRVKETDTCEHFQR